MADDTARILEDSYSNGDRYTAFNIDDHCEYSVENVEPLGSRAALLDFVSEACRLRGRFRQDAPDQQKEQEVAKTSKVHIICTGLVGGRHGDFWGNVVHTRRNSLLLKWVSFAEMPTPSNIRDGDAVTTVAV